jgi:small ligand-binding sensory domain FIST
MAVGPSAMLPKTRSFEVRAPTPTSLASAVVSRVPALGAGQLGLIFCTREASPADREIANALKNTPGTWIVATGHGVLSERGEIEGEIAATGIVLGVNDAKIVARDAADPDFGAELGHTLQLSQGASALTLIRADQLDEEWLDAFAQTRPARGGSLAFGGGTCADNLIYISEGSRVRGVKALSVVLGRARPAQLLSSAACRLISPLQRVTAADGPVLFSLDDSPALSALGEAAEELRDQSPILVAQAPTEGGLSPEGRALALKPLAGIDPTRGALVLSSDIAVGTRVAFAIRDARVGRQDFEAHLRTMVQRARGGAPDFGILISCSGRGKDLFGPSSTDARMVKARFPELPFVGLSSYFELGDMDGRLTSQVYSGIFALYCRPS